jgi:radical SAM superfamily enzyme YgiQ (UPF0313 family)
MKALLVYPEFPDTSYWGFKHALKITGKKSAFPPLNLLTVSSLLPEDWEKRLLDMNVKPLSRADLEWADIAMMSAMHIQQPSLERILEKVADLRNNGKDIKTALGGPFVTTKYIEETGLENKTEGFDDLSNKIDYLFLGEAEVTLPEFIKGLETGETRKFYVAKEFPDITSTPLPDLDLINPKDYASMAVQFSRGCPFKCKFCEIPALNGRIPRVKTNEQMIRELDHLHEFGWRSSVFIVDDNFIGNKVRVKQLLPEIAEWQREKGYPFSFFTQCSMNLAEDPDLLQKMRDAGFNSVFLGIETPDKATLGAMGKYQNVRQDLLVSVREIQSYGMDVMAGFIIGSDNDPENVAELQKEFIQKAGIPLAMVGLLNVMPGCPLYKEMESQNRLIGKMEDESSFGDNTSNGLNFITKRNRETIIAEYKKLMEKIYNSRNYYKRCLTALKHVAGVRHSIRLSIDDISALLHSIWIQGVKDSDRMEYWRFIVKSLLRYPTKLKDAVTLAVKGYHFKCVIENASKFKILLQNQQHAV